MKKMFFVILPLILVCSLVQGQKKVFLRVYGVAGNKIKKGYYAGTTDSSLLIYKDADTVEVPVSRIGAIKTRRSVGHAILVSATTGAVLFGIIGAASGEKKVNDGTLGGAFHDALTATPSEGLAAGLLAGGLLGTATGAIISLINKKIKFSINGNLQAWQKQKKILEQLTMAR